MTPADYSNRQISRTLSVMRRPLLGPLLFGIAFGGIPFGIILIISGTPDTLTLHEWYSPFTIALAALMANLSVDRSLFHILWRAFYTSIAIWVPVPTLIWTALAWHEGLEISDPRNLPLNFSLFVFLAIAITIPSWLLALGYEYMKGRRSRHVAQN